MKLSDLSNQIPTALTLAERIGLHHRQTLRRRRMTQAGLFGAGLAIGSGLAVLLAPRSGPETRRRIRERVEEAKDYVTAEAPTPTSPSRDAA